MRETEKVRKGPWSFSHKDHAEAQVFFCNHTLGWSEPEMVWNEETNSWDVFATWNPAMKDITREDYA